MRVLDAEGGLVYQSHYKVMHARCLKMKSVLGDDIDSKLFFLGGWSG